MKPGERTLLIVDDEPVVLKGLAALFGRRGYVVLPAASGRAAVDVLRDVHVDGMLIDFRIPDMRGDVLYATAVALQPHLARRTVFLTGDISDAVTEALADVHCPIVLKPFDMAELERIIAEALAADAARGERAQEN